MTQQHTDAPTGSVTRRRFLATAGTVACVSGLSGCTAWSWPWSPSAITEVSLTNDSIAVTLAAESDATMLTFVHPSGQVIWRTRLVAGQTQASIPLVYPDNGIDIPIPPGTYTVVAGNDGEELDSQEVTLTQSMTIDDVGVYTTSLQNDFGPDVTAATDITATITNTGTLPVRITFLGLTSGVPTPSQFPPPKRSMSGAFTRTRPTQQSLARHGLVGADRTVTFRTITYPLQFFGDPTDPDPPQWRGETGHCQGDIYEATLVIAGANNLRKRRTIRLKYHGNRVSTQALSTDWACTAVSIVNQSEQPTET